MYEDANKEIWMGLIPRWNKPPPPGPPAAPQSRKSICPAPEPGALKMSRPDSMDQCKIDRSKSLEFLCLNYYLIGSG